MLGAYVCVRTLACSLFGPIRLAALPEFQTLKEGPCAWPVGQTPLITRAMLKCVRVCVCVCVCVWVYMGKDIYYYERACTPIIHLHDETESALHIAGPLCLHYHCPSSLSPVRSTGGVLLGVDPMLPSDFGVCVRRTCKIQTALCVCVRVHSRIRNVNFNPCTYVPIYIHIHTYICTHTFTHQGC